MELLDKLAAMAENPGNPAFRLSAQEAQAARTLNAKYNPLNMVMNIGDPVPTPSPDPTDPPTQPQPEPDRP